MDSLKDSQGKKKQNNELPLAKLLFFTLHFYEENLQSTEIYRTRMTSL